MAAMIRMIATTISNSISEKPFCFRISSNLLISDCVVARPTAPSISHFIDHKRGETKNTASPKVNHSFSDPHLTIVTIPLGAIRPGCDFLGVHSDKFCQSAEPRHSTARDWWPEAPSQPKKLKGHRITDAPGFAPSPGCYAKLRVVTGVAGWRSCRPVRRRWGCSE